MVVWKKRGSWLARIRNSLQDSSRLRRLVIVGGVMAVGVIIMFVAKAATSTVSLETESRACSGMQSSASNASSGSFVKFKIGGCGAVLGADFYPQSDCSALQTGAYCFQRMGLGAGGWMTGVDIGKDDSVFMRSDAVVPYVLEKDSANKDIWMPLITKSSLPASITSNPNWEGLFKGGTAAAEISAVDKNLVYIRTFYQIWKADKSSGQWKLTDISSSNTGLTANLDMDPNEQPGSPADRNLRYRSKYMVASKNNPSIVYVTAFDGIYRTGDSGVNWVKVFSWDASECKQLKNACSSLIINEAENKVYAFVKNTSGLMADKNKILTASISGGNLGDSGLRTADSVRNVVYDGVGTVYYTMDNNSLAKLKNGVQTNVPLPNSDVSVGVAANKNNKVAVFAGSAHSYAVSNDGGLTWPVNVCCDAGGATLRSSDVPWMMSPNRIISDWGAGEMDVSTSGNIAFQGDRLWLSDGIGAYYRDPSTPVKDWIGYSRGIENMINNVITAFKDVSGKSRVMWSMHDRGAMMQKWGTTISEVGQPAAKTYAPNYQLYDSLRHGQQPGVSPNGRNVIYAFHGNNPRVTCSNDSGDTVRASDTFANAWDEIGSYAINDSGIGLFVPMKPREHGGFYGVIDCNATKPTMTIKSFPSNISWTDHDIGFYGSTKRLAAIDDSGNFYMAVASGTGSGYNADLNAVNVYTSQDLNSWTLVGKAGPMNDAIFGVKIRSVPGKPGVVFATNGDTGGNDATCDQSAYVRNAGSSTFNAIVGMTEVLDFGFGLPVSAGAFPQVYVSGCYSGKYGIWTATDFNPANGTASWVQIDNDTLWKNPTKTVGPLVGLDGDKVRVGCFYGIMRENGAFYACKK